MAGGARPAPLRFTMPTRAWAWHQAGVGGPMESAEHAGQGGGHLRPHICDFDPEALSRRPIATGPHCYSCTAGQGSSCGGALA